MLGLASSGLILSNYLWPHRYLSSWYALAQQGHLLCVFWGFVWISLHLGLCWDRMASIVRRWCTSQRKMFSALGWLVAFYGGYVFSKRGSADYLLGKNHFLILAAGERLLVFWLDYLAVMGLFVFCGHYGKRFVWPACFWRGGFAQAGSGGYAIYRA